MILVDADLRWPQVARRFDLPSSPGLLDVALELATLRSALRPVDLTTEHAHANGSNGNSGGVYNANTGANVASTWIGGGSLHILPGGRVPPGVGDFFALDHAKRIAGLIEGLADFVIYDAPPILRVNDAIALGSIVDYQLLVIRLQTVRRGTVKALRRALEMSPARSLGFVVNHADPSAADAYGYGEPLEAPERLAALTTE